MSKRKRILIVLGALVATVGVYVWLFGVQTFFALETRNIARKMPIVKNVPVELPDLSVSRTPGKKLSYFGYDFEVPWDDIEKTIPGCWEETRP